MARAALAEDVRAQVAEQAAVAAAMAAEAVRRGFADALAAVFGARVWVVAAGGVATLFVPSLELQGRHDPRAEAIA